MFCTLICCMDGRFIHIINEYIRNNYRYEYVDTITDAGPVNKIIYDDYLKAVEDKIVLISINKHKSDHIFIAGHSDCAGCPIDDKTQKNYIKKAVKMIREHLSDIAVTGLFVYKEGDIEILIDFV
ncbi:hypothetical protein EII29_00605 [Leptotrichia sp. OH3620_COT-345]|uniref:carbonic anhydrase n=1 Tax=Leptotrichia sp. OH3620_COT-345 TaxID=2491048 RepID=UPI000F64BFF0|nr:carbonic anhydrase [Leptotrichia sp. OH3620_COT-345]RRD40985.1 hypothetical protein EII29_00605 [Leptotrichia sp. OH3620_COT-345]